MAKRQPAPAMTSDHSRGMLAYPKPVKVSKPRKPLRRKRYMVKRAPRRLSRAGSDPAYLAWVRTRPCVGWHDCDGPIQASHLRHHTGLGLKEADRNAVPMCRGLHEQWEQHRGPFARLDNLSRFAVFMKWIAETQRAWEAR